MAARTAARGPRRDGSGSARPRSSLSPPYRAPPRPRASPRIARSSRCGMRLHRALAVAEIRERCAPMVAVGGEGVGERAIDRLPRGEVLRRALHLAFTAFRTEIATHR